MEISRLLIIKYIINISVITVSGFLDYNIIKGYYKDKSINYATIIGCFSEKEQMHIKKIFINSMTSVVNVNHLGIKESLETVVHLGVILDGDCNEAHKFLRLSGKYNFFDERHHWLVLLTKKNFTYLFEDVEMFLNSDIQLIYPENNHRFVKSYTIVDVYNPSYDRGGTTKFQRIGFYNMVEGYNRKAREACKYWIRKNMTGVTLNTVVVLPVPFEGNLLDYLDSEKDIEINTFNRFHYNVLSSCQRYYNFTPNVSLSRSWGYKQPDGSFDGLVGALERKETDYGGSPLFVRTPRAEVMQYGKKTWTLRASFIFRNPKSKNSIDAFVRPLSVSMWGLTAASAISLLIFLRVSCLCEKKYNNRRCVDASWSYVMICVIGALCQQGMTATPRFPSGRIVTLFMFLFALLIYQFYSASLVSHLLMKSPTRIKSLDDILTSNMRVGCEDVLYNRDYFKYTSDDAARKLYYEKIRGKNNNSNFLSPAKGLELVEKGQYAFHVEVDTAYPIIRNTFKEKAICQLSEVPLFKDQPMHANYQKDSPYKEMFDTCLQRLDEVGILTREKKFWHPVKPDCLQSSRSVGFNIGLDDFYPALMVLGIGISCSLLLLICEIITVYKGRFFMKETREISIYPFVK